MVTTSDRKRLTRMEMVGGILTVLVYGAIALVIAYAIVYFWAPHFDPRRH